MMGRWLAALCGLAIFGPANTHELTGDWATQGYSARVRIGHCDDQPQLLCGTITWLWEPTHASGAPMTDENNPQADLRRRPLLGLPLLRHFHRRDAAHWQGGTIYDPEAGRTYKASLTLVAPDRLEVEGCLLFVCQKQLWRRAESMCRF